MNPIIKYFRDKKNSKLFAKLEPTVLKFLMWRLSMCEIESLENVITVKFNGSFEDKQIKIKLLLKPDVNVLQLEYENKKLFKKYSKFDFHHYQIDLIEILAKDYLNRNNRKSSQKLDPKSEKLEKLNKTLESYQNQYDEILKWEKLNGKTHQDRIMVTSMIANVKDKIEKITNKTF